MGQETNKEVNDAKANKTPDSKPDAIMLSREDVLSVHLLYERELRLNAEIQALRHAQTINKFEMSQKYGVDFNEYLVEVENNIARRIGSQNGGKR